jgi:hypothetical protein
MNVKIAAPRYQILACVSPPATIQTSDGTSNPLRFGLGNHDPMILVGILSYHGNATDTSFLNPKFNYRGLIETFLTRGLLDSCMVCRCGVEVRYLFTLGKVYEGQKSRVGQDRHRIESEDFPCLNSHSFACNFAITCCADYFPLPSAFIYIFIPSSNFDLQNVLQTFYPASWCKHRFCISRRRSQECGFLEPSCFPGGAAEG